MFYDIEKISFQKIDKIALKNNFKKSDERRIKAGIVYAMQTLGAERGDTYFYKEEIFQTLKIVINYEHDYEEFENYLEEFHRQKELLMMIFKKMQLKKLF